MPYSVRQDDPATRAVLRSIGRRVMYARAGRGLSQRGLEALTGIDQTTICRLENGLAPGIRLDKLALIVAITGIDRLDRVQPAPPIHHEPV